MYSRVRRENEEQISGRAMRPEEWIRLGVGPAPSPVSSSMAAEGASPALIFFLVPTSLRGNEEFHLSICAFCVICGQNSALHLPICDYLRNRWQNLLKCRGESVFAQIVLLQAIAQRSGGESE